MARRGGRGRSGAATRRDASGAIPPLTPKDVEQMSVKFTAKAKQAQAEAETEAKRATEGKKQAEAKEAKVEEELGMICYNMI